MVAIREVSSTKVLGTQVKKPSNITDSYQTYAQG